MDFGYGEKPGATGRARARLDGADRDAERRRRELGLDDQAERTSIQERIQQQHREVEAVDARIADPSISKAEREGAKAERAELMERGRELAEERRRDREQDDEEMEA
jgi:hypothetical protein